MAFKFRLEKVLDYRKQLEEQAMQALARSRAERDAEAGKLERLRQEQGRQLARMQNSAAMSGAERWLTQSYIQALLRDIEYSGKRLSLLEEEVQVRQNELVQKAQDRELLDRLRSRQANRFMDEEKHREQRGYDETATIRHQKETV